MPSMERKVCEDGRKADRVAFGGESLTQLDGQGGNGIQVVDPVAVEGLGKLAGAEFGLFKVGYGGAKLLNRKAKQRLHRLRGRRLNRFRAGRV